MNLSLQLDRARQLAIHHRTLPAKSLFGIAEQERLGSHLQSTSASPYALVIRAMHCRHEYEEGAKWWSKLRATGIVNEEGAFWGMRTLVHAGKVDDALEILEAIYSSDKSMHQTTFKLEGFDIRVLPTFIQHFFYALQNINRPDLIFIMWDAMDTLYAVKPNGTLLETLADAARRALKLDLTLLPIPALVTSSLPTIHARSDLLARMRLSLAEGRRPSTIRWRGHHPAVVARQVWRSVIIRNVPSTEYLQCPIIDTKFHPPASTERIELVELVGPHHDFHPTNLTFLNYFHLLACMSLTSEIPLGLAWMRASGIQPSMQVLGFAFAYCARAEMLHLPDGYGETYTSLLQWVREWLGEEWKLEPGIGYWLLKARGRGGRNVRDEKPSLLRQQRRPMPRLPPRSMRSI